MQACDLRDLPKPPVMHNCMQCHAVAMNALTLNPTAWLNMETIGLAF